MRLTSPVFEDGGDMPSQYTCDGDNISPPLTISGVPESTISLALVMDDPDAIKPAGKVWDHWIVFNIPPDTTEIPEREEPEGMQGKTSFGKMGYGGPCPPDGRHNYIFKLYALDAELGLKEGATKKELEKAMQGHIIEQVKLTGSYVRG